MWYVPTVLIIMVVQRNVGTFLNILRAQAKPWWYYVGFGGVPIVVASSWGTPDRWCCHRLGVLGGRPDDHQSGVRPARRGYPRPQSPFRAVAFWLTLVALAGLALAISASSGTSTSLWAMIATGLIIAIAGAGLSAQNVGNGAVVARTGYHLLPCLTSVIGGTVLMSAILVIAAATGNLSVTFPPLSSWWMYMGGPVGAAIVLCSAWAIRRLGAFRLTLAVVAGQMVTAVLPDLATGTPVPPATVAAAITMVLATTLETVVSVIPTARGAVGR